MKALRRVLYYDANDSSVAIQIAVLRKRCVQKQMEAWR